MNLNEYLVNSGNAWKNKAPQFQNTELRKLFDILSNYILELDIEEHILFFEVYTSEVYPRNILLNGRDCILWDNHFWRLFGHFVNGFFLYQDKHQNDNNVIMYLKSIQLLFLSSRFDGIPALSRFIAEEYKGLEQRIPSHSESDNILDILKQNKHIGEFNVGCIFGYCHEIAHVAIKRNNTLAWTVKNLVIDYCKSFVEIQELTKQVDELSDKQGIVRKFVGLDTAFSISNQVLENRDGAILEEMCCDIMALYAISTHLNIQGKSNQEIADTLGYIELFFLFSWWLASNERFYNTLRMVYENPIANDMAFIDENNPYYGFGDKITEELAVRTNFSFGVFSNYSKVPINDVRERQKTQIDTFINVMNQANGYDIMERVLSRYAVSKKDFASQMRHQLKRDQLVEW